MVDAVLPNFVDVAFAVRGATLPREHRALLATAIDRGLPGLATDARWGVHLLNLAQGCGETDIVCRRTRLVLRVPRRMAEALLTLAGTELNLAGRILTLGPGKVRELLPHGTLYAHFVAADVEDESAFLARAEADLARLRVRGRAICGRWQSLAAPALTGCSLMVDGLSSDDSLRVLEHGLGPHRRLGCGLFVPHKWSAAVGAPA